MKTLKIILLTTISLAAIACGRKKNAEQEPDPAAVAEKYVEAMMNYDFNEAKKHVVNEALPLYEEMVNEFLSTNDITNIENIIKPIMKHAKYETVEKKVSDDKQTAEVAVQITDKTSTFNNKVFIMAREGDDWKVHHPIEIWSVTMDYNSSRGLYIDEKGEYK